MIVTVAMLLGIEDIARHGAIQRNSTSAGVCLELDLRHTA